MIRLFVGVDGTNCDLESQAVLEYTVRKYASEPVEITWMQQAAAGPWSGWQTGSARTPFSHFRWSLPAVCGFEARAIYTDSDFIFRADIAELWHQDIPGALLVRHPGGKVRTCCILFDCARAKGHIPDLDTLRAMPDANGAMHQYIRGHRDLLAGFAGDWNCIDLKGYADLNNPLIKAIHYSRIECQPSLRHALPRLKAEGRPHWYTGEVLTHWRPELVALFDAELAAAADAGYPIERYRVSPYHGASRRAFVYRQHRGVPA